MTYYDALRRTSMYSDLLQRTAVYYDRGTTTYDVLRRTTTYYDVLRRTTAYCDVLQGTTRHCGALWHTTTYYKVLWHITASRGNIWIIVGLFERHAGPSGTIFGHRIAFAAYVYAPCGPNRNAFAHALRSNSTMQHDILQHGGVKPYATHRPETRDGAA